MHEKSSAWLEDARRGGMPRTMGIAHQDLPLVKGGKSFD